MRLLVTGVGHSGTGWASQVFTRLGIECGHEAIFNHAHQQVPKRSSWAESSWAAVPQLPAIDAAVIWIVRDPLAVVRSAMRTDFLGDGPGMETPYAQFIGIHDANILDGHDPLGRVIRWVSRWDRSVADHATPTRIEDADVQTVAEWFRLIGRAPRRPISDVLAEVGTTTNTHAPSRTDVDAQITWSSIAQHPDGDELFARAERFNYRTGD